MRFFNWFLVSLLIASAVFTQISFAEVRTHSHLLQTPRQAFMLQNAWYRTHNVSEGARIEYRRTHPKADQIFIKNYETGRELNFNTLEANWGDPTMFRPIFYFIQDDAKYTATVKNFLIALMRHKKKLMSIYNLRNDTYNKMAAMAFGIMGNESKFGQNWKYPLKENSQWMISLYKNITTNSDDVVNSRGLTQIKFIPETILKAYPEVGPDTLSNPEHAAVTTIGYLAETMNLINGLKKDQEINGIDKGEVSLAYINAQNIFDYIPYVYSGRMRRLFHSPTSPQGATVVDNIYIKEMKQHMKLLFFMELPRQTR